MVIFNIEHVFVDGEGKVLLAVVAQVENGQTSLLLAIKFSLYIWHQS